MMLGYYEFKKVLIKTNDFIEKCFLNYLLISGVLLFIDF